MISIPIVFNADEKGYFDRECPNEECNFNFKINIKDWEEKVSDEEFYCPRCGHKEEVNQWFTQNQIENIKEIGISYAKSYIGNEINKTFKRLQTSTRSNKYFKITYKPNRKTTFTNNPIGSSDSWELEIKCDNCNTRYSVIGTAYFCPCCGESSIDHVFENSLISIGNMIRSTDELKELFIAKYTLDEAENMINSMVESGFTDIISAFQNYMFRIQSINGKKKTRPNDFQIIKKGSNIFRKDFGFGYDDILSNIELDKLYCYFQQRHIIEHNGGMIDEKYLQKVPNSCYKLNQRVIIKHDDVLDMINIVKFLVTEVKIRIN